MFLKQSASSSANAKDNSEKPSGNHINNIISEGFENNNSKPFCNYMKSKKQDNIGVAPLKRYGGLTSAWTSPFLNTGPEFALSQSLGRVPQSTDFWKMFLKQVLQRMS
jgi:hypothetical protein